MDHQYQIEITTQQSAVKVPFAKMKKFVAEVLKQEGVTQAEIDIVVVDNQEIHRVNQQFLQHDYPTDVVTFPLSDDLNPLEGEIVLSAEYAQGEAEKYNWPVESEMLLYAVHGALHLVGYDDLDPESKTVMRKMEQKYLRHFGMEPPYAAGEIEDSFIAPNSESGERTS